MRGERIGFGEGFVFLVKSGGVRCRNRIVSLFAGTEVVRVFADNRGVCALLSGGVLDLDDAGERFVVGIVHLHGGLVKTRRAFEGGGLRPEA